MATENKVRFGFKNIYLFPVTSNTPDGIEYGSPIRLPGGVAINLNASEESNTFYADDEPYWSTFTNSGMEGDLEIALIPEEILLQIYGATKTGDGVIIEKTGDSVKQVAMAFEIDGDQYKTRFQFPLVTLGRSPFSAKTKEKGADPQTEKINITILPVGDGIFRIRIPKASTAYENAFKQVYKQSEL